MFILHCEIFENAMKSAHLALELDPNDPEAHRIMGAIKIFMEKDYETSLNHYKRTRELFPQSISANNKIKEINALLDKK